MEIPNFHFLSSLFPFTVATWLLTLATSVFRSRPSSLVNSDPLFPRHPQSAQGSAYDYLVYRHWLADSLFPFPFRTRRISTSATLVSRLAPGPVAVPVLPLPLPRRDQIAIRPVQLRTHPRGSSCPIPAI